jgi:hypothetical protein
MAASLLNLLNCTLPLYRLVVVGASRKHSFQFMDFVKKSNSFLLFNDVMKNGFDMFLSSVVDFVAETN